MGIRDLKWRITPSFYRGALPPACQGPEGPLMALWSLDLLPPLPKAGANSNPLGLLQRPHSRDSSAPHSPALPGHGHTDPGPPTRDDSFAWGLSLSLTPGRCRLGLPRCPRPPCSWLGCTTGPGSWALPCPVPWGPCSAATSQGAAGLPGTTALPLQWGFLWNIWRPLPDTHLIRAWC